MKSESGRLIVSRRVFAALPQDLWESFRNPDVLTQWWGPAGFTNEFHAFEFRAGGTWDFTMRGPDGDAYRMRKVFVEITEPRRIVLDHPDPVHGFRMHIDFREIAEGTQLEWLMRFDLREEADRVRAIVEAANEQNFDRLAATLGEKKPET